MRKTVFLILATLMLLVPVLGASAQDASHVYVYGDVRDATYEADGTFPGIVGAVVTVSDAYGNVVASSETVSVEGAFGIGAMLRQATYTLSVELPAGYTMLSIEVDGKEVAAGEDASSIDIIIDAAAWNAGTFGPILVRAISEGTTAPVDPCASLPEEITVYGRVEDLGEPLDDSQWPQYAGIEGLGVRLEYYWEYLSEGGTTYGGWTEVPSSPKTTGDRGYFAFTDKTRGCKYRLSFFDPMSPNIRTIVWAEFYACEAESLCPIIIQGHSAR